jgi:ubiquinone/menaquinone biosynthesis C-methylase UbiE
MSHLIRRALHSFLRRMAGSPEPMDPVRAYDLWSSSYDDQTDNVLIALDEQLVGDLLQRLVLKGKAIADVGCGTGRHWEKILAREPAQLVGYDISPGMLTRLRLKYPQAAVHRLSGYGLPETAERSFDVVISTLTLGYLREPSRALAEWSRVLKPGGDLMITDFHPAASARADRSFRHENKTIAIRHYVHSLGSLEAAARKYGLDLLSQQEKVVDDSVRAYYEANGALAVFNRSRGLPLIYGLHFRSACPQPRP